MEGEGTGDGVAVEVPPSAVEPPVGAEPEVTGTVVKVAEVDVDARKGGVSFKAIL